MSKIFISYSHRDRAFTKRLIVDLTRLGATVWVDDAEIEIGESLATAIERGITSSDYFGVVLSPEAVASHWVRQELASAFEEEGTGRVKILPLLLADCDLPLSVKGRRYADFRKPEAYSESLAKLAARLGLHDAGSMTLSSEECESIIRRLAAARKLTIEGFSAASLSPLGTMSFKARLADGKGVIYCHASGQKRGSAFYVRKGIGWYYEHLLEGSASALGLPTSNEEVKDQRGRRISLFENGYIEWTPVISIAKAVSTISGTEQILGTRHL